MAPCRHPRSRCGPNVLPTESRVRSYAVDELGRDAEHRSHTRSHSGASSRTQKGPLIRPFGAPSPQGEKGRCGSWLSWRIRVTTDNSAATAFINIGERTNVTGSAKFRKLIEAGDYQAALAVARS